jgi:lysophospholipase L1-like esterase
MKVSVPQVDACLEQREVAPEYFSVEAKPSVSPKAFVYLFHLVFSVLLLLDVLHAHHLRMALRSDMALGGFAALWMIVGILAYSVSRDRQEFLERAARPLLSFYAVLFVLCLIEAGLLVTRRELPPAIWKPGTRLIFYPDNKTFPGVSSVSHFRTNEFGLRGPSLPSGKDIYKIITVGGSTTLCLMLDDQKTWPQQLMNVMNDHEKRLSVWVSNAGVNGHTAVHHLMMLRAVPILNQADVLIFMMGLNDLQFTLSHEGMPTQPLLEQGSAQFREEVTAASYNAYPLYRRLRLFRVSRRAYDVAFERINEKDEKETLNETQLRRLRNSTLPLPMPDLAVGMAEYRKRLEDLADECRRRSIRCLFLTQPSLWRPDLPMDSQRLLLFGWVGPPFQPRGHVSMSDVKNALDLYNSAMLDVCIRSRIECLDLASVLPKDQSVFYDDVHLTERGAQLVADKIAMYLLSLAPFQSRNVISDIIDTKRQNQPF